MKQILAPLLVFLLGCTFSSHAQSDSSRYKKYTGTYAITTPSFPVSEVIVYWQDSVLAYKAGGAKGTFIHLKAARFSFTNDDHAGTVTFKGKKRSNDSDILVVMDGETYLGAKKP